MKTTVKILASLSMLIAAVSCQQFYVDTQMTPEKMAANARLESNVFNAYTVSASNPQPVSFNITSNVPWSIVRNDNAEWCTISPMSSAVAGLNTDVTIEAMENEALEDRSASFTIRSDSYPTKSYTFTITQGRRGQFYVTPITKAYSAMGGPLNFTISTNYPWEVRSDAGWLSFSPASGEGSSDPIQIVATAERSNVLSRTATISVIVNDVEESFEVRQEGKFELTEPSGVFEDVGGTMDFKIKTDLEWEVSVDKMWLTVSEESGEGDGTAKILTLTAEANDAVERKATVTVSAAGENRTFQVAQNGVKFEIVEPASTELSGISGELVLEVNTALAWEPFSEEAWMAVEKVDDAHFKVSATWNPYFAPRTANVGIKSGSNTNAIALTQDVNFTVENAEVQEDGSVKILGDQKSRVYLKEPARYVSIVLEMGASYFDDKAQFFMCTHDAAGDSELQCQINLAGNNKRLRTNGSHTTYGSTKFDITKDELNAMNEYRVDFRPGTTAGMIALEFFYNLISRCLHDTYSSKPIVSPYADPAATGTYFFGTESAVSGSGTWYIVKSCNVTFLSE